jgi:hypothetical protein
LTGLPIVCNFAPMTNNAQATVTADMIRVFGRPGHTLTIATFDATFAIEGDYMVNKFGTVIGSPIVEIDLETPFIARVEFEDDFSVRLFSAVDSFGEPQITVLRNVPLTD